MTGFVLDIFPQGSLDSSVITTVYIGILVLAFFNLRFGWVASGFIVPGYMVPLIILKPWSAAVIILESIIIYLAVRLLSDQLSKRRLSSDFFGRDRFFALLVCSIIVRVLCDGWLLPALGAYLNDTLRLTFDYRNNLHSFGLIIISLIANQFWKPGLIRGSLTFAVTVGITWFIVRFGLMEYTNFTISSIGYLYEDLAANILAGPKAYIILITAAYFASRMNLFYGWEFSGILIPALLTLLWYNPHRIVTTFFETLIVTFLAAVVLKTPVFATVTMEGTRKLVLFFSVSFAYKFALAYLLLFLAPTYKVSDVYGFGYLLPTLLAIKMHDAHSFAKTIRVTLQTSLVAIVVASVVGFSLTLIPDILPGHAPTAKTVPSAVTEKSGVRLMDKLRADKLTLYKGNLESAPSPPLTRDIDIFSRALRSLSAYAENRDPSLLAEGSRVLALIGYGVTVVEQRYLYLSERDPGRGWGIYVIDMSRNGGLLVEVPAPITEQGSLEAGTALFVTLNAHALAVSGSDGFQISGETFAVTRNVSTLFHAFQREMSRRNVLQVRIYTRESARGLAGLRKGMRDISPPSPESSLWVKTSLPPGLNLSILKGPMASLQVEWGASPMENVLRDTAVSGFAELILNATDMRRVIFQPLLSGFGTAIEERQERIDGYLQDRLLNTKGEIADKGTNLYVPPKLEELLFFDQEVLTPLYRIALRGDGFAERSRAETEELRIINAAAALAGYRLTTYRHIPTGRNFFILSERNSPEKRRYRGTYVLRIGPAAAYVIQTPRPLYEVNSFEYGVNLFDRLGARALLIGGAHPFANTDGSADPVGAAGKESLFNLVSQAILRESTGPMMVIQSRAFGSGIRISTPDADIIAAFSNGASVRGALTPLGRRLINCLDDDGVSLRFADGGPDVVGYEVGGIRQSLYLNQAADKELAILWLSPAARLTYRQQTENRRQESQFVSLGIRTEEKDLFSAISTDRLGPSSEVPRQLRARIASYQKTGDVVTLYSMIRSRSGYRFSRVIDVNTKQSFLFVRSGDGRLRLVANLVPRRADAVTAVSPTRRDISTFIDSRSATLEFGGRP